MRKFNYFYNGSNRQQTALGTLASIHGWAGAPDTISGHPDGFWIATIYMRVGSGASNVNRAYSNGAYVGLEDHVFIIQNDDTNYYSAVSGDSSETIDVIHASVGVYNGTQVKMYKDGTLRQTTATAGAYDPSSQSDSIIGLNSNGTNIMFSVVGCDSGFYPTDVQVYQWFSDLKNSNSPCIPPEMGGAPTSYRWRFNGVITSLTEDIGNTYTMSQISAANTYTQVSVPVNWAW